MEEPIELEGSKELERQVRKLQHERDSLRAELGDKHKDPRGGHTRRIVVGVAAFLSGLLIALTLLVGWAHRTVLNTDQWVKTVAPIGSDPAITDALGSRITAELAQVIDVQKIAQNALPPRAAVLAGPISGAIENFIGDQVQNVLRSDQFAQFWIAANRFAHAQVVAVLRGDTDVVQTTNGTVKLNLLPLINDALVRIETQAGNLLGRNIDLPEITSTTIPAEARQKLSAALGRPLPASFGEVVVFQSNKLAAAQDAVERFDRLVLVLVIGTPLLIALALWLSRRRRRTLIQISVIAIVLLVVMRRVVIWGQDKVVDVTKPENRAASRALVDHVMANFFTVSTFALWICALVVLAAWVTGPYALARRLRALSASAASTVKQAASRGAEDEETRRWIGTHKDGLLIGGAAAAVLLFLLFDFTLATFLVVGSLVALFEIAVMRMGTGPPPAGPAAT